MRTEDEFSGHGFASHLVRSGVELLATTGCTRCKVLHEADNEAARRAYAGAGLVQVTRDLTFAHDATGPCRHLTENRRRSPSAGYINPAALGTARLDP